MTTRTLDMANVIASDVTIAGDKTLSGDITFSGDVIPSTPLSHKNLIINGAMQVAQRATSATDVNGSSGYFTVDRWKHWEATDGIYQSSQYSMSNAEQNTTGHSKALKLNVKSGSADSSLGSTQYAFVGTLIEAQDLQHLQYGTANAKTITLSFWIKSSKTGTYNLSINKFDSTATRIAMEYTINSANTWEQKTITITPTEGSTSLITSSAGAIGNDNGIGMEIIWILSVGSTYSGATANTWTTNQNHIGTSNQVNWMDSDSNDLYITGVQLEIGDNATPFEHRSFADEFARCARYYFRIEGDIYDMICVGQRHNTSNMIFPYQLPVPLRTNSPTITQANLGIWYNFVGSWSTSYSGVNFYSQTNSVPFHTMHFQLTGTSTSINHGILATQNNGYLAVDAEL